MLEYRRSRLGKCRQGQKIRLRSAGAMLEAAGYPAWQRWRQEMSPDYHERTRIVAYRDFLQPLGAFFAGALLWFITREVFDDKIQGMRVVSLGVAALLVLLGLIAFLFPRSIPRRFGGRRRKRFHSGPV